MWSGWARWSVRMQVSIPPIGAWKITRYQLTLAVSPGTPPGRQVCGQRLKLFIAGDSVFGLTIALQPRLYQSPRVVGNAAAVGAHHRHTSPGCSCIPRRLMCWMDASSFACMHGTQIHHPLLREPAVYQKQHRGEGKTAERALHAAPGERFSAR